MKKKLVFLSMLSLIVNAESSEMVAPDKMMITSMKCQGHITSNTNQGLIALQLENKRIKAYVQLPNQMPNEVLKLDYPIIGGYKPRSYDKKSNTLYKGTVYAQKDGDAKTYTESLGLNDIGYDFGSKKNGSSVDFDLKGEHYYGVIDCIEIKVNSKRSF
jgi:hypothetical protein